MPPRQFKTANEVVVQLKSVSRTIQLRMGLRPVEEQRVRKALILVKSHITGELKPKQITYKAFLEHVLAVVGPYGVIVCAAGLGSSAVVNMKDLVRVEVPVNIKESENDILCSVLEDISEKFRPTYFPDISKESTERTPNSDRDGQLLEMQMVDQNTMTKNISQYAGDAYELTWEDAETLVGFKKTLGQVYLVETYSRKTSSFMIVPVSDEMTRLFAMQRARV